MTPTHHTVAVNPPPRDPTIWGAMAAVVIIFTVVAILSYPVVSLAIITTGVGLWLAVGHGIPAIKTRFGGQTRRLTIPGLGTIEYRLTPR